MTEATDDSRETIAASSSSSEYFSYSLSDVAASLGLAGLSPLEYFRFCPIAAVSEIIFVFVCLFEINSIFDEDKVSGNIRLPDRDKVSQECLDIDDLIDLEDQIKGKR
jgi:hypothetical protein